MAIRFTPLFDDGSGVPVTSGTYDTEQAAAHAGREAATGELTFVGVARHLGPTELSRHVAWLAQNAGPPAVTDGGNRRSGLITRWTAGDTAGFLTDRDGHSWFVSRDELPEGHETLPTGTPVTFAGSPYPAPGKKYPQARSVRLASA